MDELGYLRGKVARLEKEKALAIECWAAEEALRVCIEEERDYLKKECEFYHQRVDPNREALRRYLDEPQYTERGERAEIKMSE